MLIDEKFNQLIFDSYSKFISNFIKFEDQSGVSHETNKMYMFTYLELIQIHMKSLMTYINLTVKVLPYYHLNAPSNQFLFTFFLKA